MEQLLREASSNTPKVLLDPENRVFEIIGESRPEDVKAFYEPIFSWFDSYLSDLKTKGLKDEFILKMFLEYFNSSSAKYILNLAKKMFEFKSSGIPVTIEWCYLEDDEDMKQTGEEMERMSKVPFKYTVMQ
jgi:hypothetical protein